MHTYMFKMNVISLEKFKKHVYDYYKDKDNFVLENYTLEPLGLLNLCLDLY